VVDHTAIALGRQVSPSPYIFPDAAFLGHTHLDDSVDAKQTGYGACDTQPITDYHGVAWEIPAQYCLKDVIGQGKQTRDRWHPEIAASPTQRAHLPTDYICADAEDTLVLNRLPHHLAYRVVLLDCSVLPWLTKNFSMGFFDVSSRYILLDREDISGVWRRYPNIKRSS
jgi:hypothetical protein